MSRLYRDEAVVLKTIKLGEADRIITLFTRDNGKVRAVAKGIRKTKSRFGGRLEPFTRVRLMFHRGRNLDTITSAEVITAFREVREDYRSLMAAAVLADLVEKMTPDRERAFSTYALLVKGLEALGRGHADSIVPGFLVKLLSLSGYHPQLTACSGCGRVEDLAGFSPGMGGVVCAGCGPTAPDAFQVPTGTIALLGLLLSSDLGSPSISAPSEDATEILRRYAEYHLERPLKSLQMLAV